MDKDAQKYKVIFTVEVEAKTPIGAYHNACSVIEGCSSCDAISWSVILDDTIVLTD
jgi:hypothetical protein